MSAPDLDEFLVPLPQSEQRPEAVGELNWCDLDLRLIRDHFGVWLDSGVGDQPPRGGEGAQNRQPYGGIGQAASALTLDSRCGSGYDHICAADRGCTFCAKPHQHAAG